MEVELVVRQFLLSFYPALRNSVETSENAFVEAIKVREIGSYILTPHGVHVGLREGSRYVEYRVVDIETNCVVYCGHHVSLCLYGRAQDEIPLDF